MKDCETITKTNDGAPKLSVMTTRHTTWETIRDMEDLPIGSEVEITLKDGSTVVFQLAATNVYGAGKAFVTKDCVGDDAVMNEHWTNDGGWPESRLRNVTMKQLLELLPDDLREIIIPRAISQEIRGKLFEGEDLIWVPSYTEVVGPDGWGAKADINDIHFPLFSSERARSKQDRLHQETVWWWLRSPYAGNATAFYSITTSGSSNIGYAINSYGVAFGFLI